MASAGLPPAQPVPLARIAAVWLVLCALLVLTGLGNILSTSFPDPDDTLRLVQLRDLLAGQGWFDTVQYRINPPEGTPMHWSRLVDLPLALLIAALAPLLGQPLAESVALVAIPLLTLGAIVLLVGRMAARFFSAEVVGLACLACGLLPLLVAQVQPLRIDHHGWQIAAALLAVSGLLAQTARRGGWLAGLALAAGLTISIELLPFAAGLAGVLFWRWWRDPAQRWWLVHFLAALASGLAALFLATRGLGDLALWCDAISPAHLGFFALVAAGSAVIAALVQLPRLAVLGLLGLTGCAGLGLFALAAPVCLAAPFGELDPLVHSLWYANVLEGQPLWRQDLPAAIPVLLQALVALAVCLHLWRSAPAGQAAFWRDYLLLFLAALATGLLVWRAMALAGALSALPLGWLAAQLLARLRAGRSLPGKLAMALGVALVLLPALPVTLARAAWPLATTGPAVGGTMTVRQSACAINRNADLLAALPDQTLLTPFDIGPAILERTGHSVVATGHHRANPAMRDVLLAFTSPAPEARGIIAGRGAQLVVVCTDLPEAAMLERANPAGLMADLRHGRVPAWLEPLELGGPEALRAWRVVE